MSFCLFVICIASNQLDFCLANKIKLYYPYVLGFCCCCFFCFGGGKRGYLYYIFA